MNLVSLLIAPAVVKFRVGEDENDGLRIASRAGRRGVIVGRGVRQQAAQHRGREEPVDDASPQV